MTFRVGQKVVCVDDSADSLGRQVPLVLGAVYTIKVIGEDDYGSTGFLLDEVYMPPHPRKTSRFASRRFRPVVERKTDISIFTRMLTGSKIGADA